MADRDIRELVRHLAGTHQVDTLIFIDVEVDSVDPDAMTCQGTAITGPTGNAIADIRLMSSVDDGVLLLPTEGSTISVLMSTFAGPIMVGWSGLDKIILFGGDLGGLVKVVELTEKLNNLEKAYNDLVEKFNAHTHNVTAVGSPTGPNIAPEGTTLTLTVRTDIENPNITQG